MTIDQLIWTYEPSGDVDGDPRYDGVAGVDHFVMEGDVEVACAPDERRARLIAAAPKLLKALKGVVRIADRKTDEFDAARDAIAEVTGETDLSGTIREGM